MTTNSLPEPQPVPAPKEKPKPKPLDFPPSVREIEKRWKGLKSVDKRLLSAVRRRTSRSGWGWGRASKKELADETDSSVATVERRIKWLGEKHLLLRKTQGKIEKETSAKGSPGPKGKNLYRVERQSTKKRPTQKPTTTKMAERKFERKSK